MTYEFQCEEGHVTEHVCPVALRPDTIKCKCGLIAKRGISMPLSMSMNLGNHGTIDSSERAYGSKHVEGILHQRDTVEQRMAMGVSEAVGDFKSTWAQPRPEKVREIKEKIKSGWKPSEAATFGVKSEHLQKLGIK